MRTLALAVLLFSAQTPATFHGLWVGTLQSGLKELRLVVRIDPGPSGPRVTVTNIDRDGADHPAENVTISGDVLRFDVKGAGGAFAGSIHASAKTITGTWTQRMGAVPLVLERTDRAPVLHRPQEPIRPLPYDEEDVTFLNAKAGIRLAGTLTRPSTGGPHPAVVLVSGSGPQDRDERIYGHRPFLVLADDLTRRGIAVLRFDDRGVGGSGGTRAEATTEDYTDDALAGVAYLKGRRDIDAARIGVIGHSEGGLIAPLAAVRSRDVAFIVIMAGPGISGKDISILQARTMMKAAGVPEEFIDFQSRLQKKCLDVLTSETSEAAIRAGVDKALREELAAISEAALQQLPLLRQQMEPQIQRALMPWSRFFMVYDPRPTLTQLRIPVLAINGDKDVQVPAAENLTAIESALRAAGNTAYRTLTMPGLNHLFQTAVTGAQDEYGKIEETFAPSALRAIGDWIVEQALRGRTKK